MHTIGVRPQDIEIFKVQGFKMSPVTAEDIVEVTLNVATSSVLSIILKFMEAEELLTCIMFLRDFKLMMGKL